MIQLIPVFTDVHMIFVLEETHWLGDVLTFSNSTNVLRITTNNTSLIILTICKNKETLQTIPVYMYI